MVWSPHKAEIFASASGDCSLKLWDTRSPPEMCAGSVRAHEFEVLSVDWLKYSPDQLVTASVDRSLRTWDARALSRPLSVTLNAHSLAIRKVKSSPHHPEMVHTASYDCTAKTWAAPSPIEAGPMQPVDVAAHHSEFVVGIDCSLFVEDQLASCGWDGKVCVWKLGGFK